MKNLLFGCIAATAGLVNAAQPYSSWMADSLISRNVSKTRFYAESTFYQGVLKVYNATGNSKYEDYVKDQIDAVITEEGEISGWKYTVSNLDDLLIGRILFHFYNKYGTEKYKTAIDFLRQRLDIHPRTESGGFWHKDPVYPNQMWLDGLFMAGPFYAEYTSRFQPSNITAWDDIINQFDLIEAHCKNATTGLLVHGYDESKARDWADPVTGGSPHVWSRAVGWYAMALVEVLDYFPKRHSGRVKLIKYLKSVSEAVKKAQDTSGGFWLVMDEPYPGQEGNYFESSAEAMFTYAWLKAIRKGYVSSRDYKAVANKSYNHTIQNFVAQTGTNGTLNWEGTVVIGSLSGNASYEYYVAQNIVQNDLKGVGPFIYAATEYERQ